MAENNVKNITSIEEDQKVKDYSARLRDLRRDGVTKISDCRMEIVALKKNKLMDEGERNKRIAELERAIGVAKEVEAKNKAEIDAIAKEAVAYVNQKATEIEKAVTERQKGRMAKAKEYYLKEVEQIKADAEKRKADLHSSIKDPQMLKSELDIASYELKSALFDSKSRYKRELDKARAAMNQAYVDHIQKNRELRNGKTNFSENMKLKYKNFVFNFDATQFFLTNGLYIAILIFFIVCIIVAPIRGNGNLLTLPNIFTRSDPSCRNRPLRWKNGRPRFRNDRAYPASGNEHRYVLRTRPLGFLIYPDASQACDEPWPLCNPLFRFQRVLRILCGKAQDAPVHLHDGNSAHHLRNALLWNDGNTGRINRFLHQKPHRWAMGAWSHKR